MKSSRAKNEKPKKKKRGRPIGGDTPEEIRKYWRELQRKHRAKKSKEKKT